MFISSGVRLMLDHLSSMWPRRNRGNQACSQSGIESLLKHSRSLVDAEQDDTNLPYWALESLNDNADRLPELQGARTRFMRRVFSSRKRHQEWEKVMAAAQMLDTTNMLNHFTAVTGHSLQDIPARPHRVFSRTARFHSRLKRGAVMLQHVDMSPKNRVARSGSRAVFSTLALYVAFILVGTYSIRLDPSALVIQLPEYSWVDIGGTPRGREIYRDTYVSRRYQAALKQMRAANTSIIGYLPGLGADLLNDAISELERAIAFQKEGGYVHPQALLILADAYIRAGQPGKSVGPLNEIIERDGRMSAEARQMKARLQQKGLIGQGH